MPDNFLTLSVKEKNTLTCFIILSPQVPKYFHFETTSENYD